MNAAAGSGTAIDESWGVSFDVGSSTIRACDAQPLSKVGPRDWLVAGGSRVGGEETHWWRSVGECPTRAKLKVLEARDTDWSPTACPLGAVASALQNVANTVHLLLWGMR